MDNLISNIFRNNKNKNKNKNKKKKNTKKNINEDLLIGKKLQSKRLRMIQNLQKNTKLMEGFTDMPLSTEDKTEFNNMKTAQTNMQRGTSSLANLLKNTLFSLFSLLLVEFN